LGRENAHPPPSHCGPSKTADFEFTLARGVRGQKDLIVFIVLDETPKFY
jgi:L-lactate utilization protein LutC